MSKASQKVWLAGVDGCPGGKWIAVFSDTAGTVLAPRVFARFADIANAETKPSLIAVDMPIGLPDRSPAKGRIAEQEARAKIGMRRSSVFRIPSRAAAMASVANTPADPTARFQLACEIARQTSDDNKAFAKQGFYILDKVIEVDSFVRSEQAQTVKVYESHPEVAFWRMNGEKEVSLPKKKKSRPHPEGLAVRRDLLVKAGIPENIVHETPPRGAGVDDMLDALACLIVARRIHAGTAISLPADPPIDAQGLPMAIWA